MVHSIPRKKFPDECSKFQEIILTCFMFETIFDVIAENSSCSEHGETKDTSTYCMYTSMYNTGM